MPINYSCISCEKEFNFPDNLAGAEPSMDLVEKNICLDSFHDAYDAKNYFYKSETANKEVLGIGFCKEHDFLIERNQFPYKTIELKKEKTSSKFIDKYHDLLVVSLKYLDK